MLVLLFYDPARLNNSFATITSILALNPASVLDGHWYVTYIMLLYAAYFGANKLHLSQRIKIFLMMLAGVILGSLSLMNILPRYSGAWYYSFAFAAGMCLYTAKAKVTHLQRYSIAVISSTCISLICYAIAINTEGMQSYLFIMLMCLIFTALICLLMSRIEFRCTIFLFIGKHSLWIFLSNTFVISLIKRFFLEYSISFSVLFRLLSFIVVLVIGCFFSKLYSTITKIVSHKIFYLLGVDN